MYQNLTKLLFTFSLNTDPTKNPYAPKPKGPEETYKQPYDDYYKTPKYYL